MRAAVLTIVTTVAAATSPTCVPGTILTTVSSDATPATILTTVSRAAADAWDSPVLYSRPRVILGPLEVDPGDIVDVEISRDLDSHSGSARITLRGAPYSLAVTSRVWSRGTTVEIWRDHGPQGAVRSTIRFVGCVLTCDQGGTPLEVRISCSDSAHADGAELCLEVEPFADLTRLEVVQEAAAAIGLGTIDGPPGAVYHKPVQAIGAQFFGWLREFSEPEGWKLRRLLDPDVERWELFVPALKREPQAPDAVWDASLLQSPPDSTPPEEAPSRWVIHGTGAVSVDELGLETTTTNTRIEAMFAPAVAVYQQDSSDGSMIDLGTTGPAEALRTVTEIVDEVSKRGGKLVRQLTVEKGWYNLAAAKYTTGGSPGAGPGPGGLYWTNALVDSNGDYVTWYSQRYGEIARRETLPRYSINGDLTDSEIRDWTLYRRLAGVRESDSEDISVIGVMVGDDDQSYLLLQGTLTLEKYGLSQVSRLSYDYSQGSDGGPVVLSDEVMDVYSWGVIGAAIGPDVEDHWVRNDGRGQTEIAANWRRTSRTEVKHIVSQGLERGTVESRYGYAVPHQVNGTYDWGDFRAGRLTERWRLIERRNETYNALSEDTYEVILVDSQGSHPPRKVYGRLPVPRYRLSPWSRLVQSPIQVVVTDAVAAGLFGPRLQSLDSPYIQDTTEALAVIARRRDVLLSHLHEVSVPATPVMPGDTVLLWYPESGINARALVQRVTERYAGPSASATYVLRQPLLEA